MVVFLGEMEILNESTYKFGILKWSTCGGLNKKLKLKQTG